MSKLCPDCHHLCTSHAECLKYQDFNIVVENAQAIAKLKKDIKSATPTFKGKNKQWFDKVPLFMEDKSKHLSDNAYKQLPEDQYGYRFATITFDPKKFSLNELCHPQKLVNYIGNALEDLQSLYTKCYLTYEVTKLGIVHAHINYSCDSVLTQTTFLLRLKYYFSNHLNNKHAIHDRIFNINGINYMTKSDKHTVKGDTKLFKDIFVLHSNAQAPLKTTSS